MEKYLVAPSAGPASSSVGSAAADFFIERSVDSPVQSSSFYFSSALFPSTLLQQYHAGLFQVLGFMFGHCTIFS